MTTRTDWTTQKTLCSCESYLTCSACGVEGVLHEEDCFILRRAKMDRTFQALDRDEIATSLLPIIEAPKGCYCETCLQDFASCPDCGLFLPSHLDADNKPFEVCECVSFSKEFSR